MTEKPEGKPSIEERVAKLKAEGKREDEIKLILFEEYPDGEVMKSGFLKKEEEPPKEIPVSPEERASFEERLEELEASETNKHDICRTLALENYNPGLLVGKFGGLYRKVAREIKAERAKEEDSHMAALAGPAKGEGYLDVQKERIRSEFSRDTVVMKFVVDLGWWVFLAALSKAGIPPETIRMMASDPEGLSKALVPIRETVFKALEYYDPDKINKVEGERNEAQLYAAKVEVAIDNLKNQMTPRNELLQLIMACLMSGSFNVDAYTILLNKLLSLEVAEVGLEAYR